MWKCKAVVLNLFVAMSIWESLWESGRHQSTNLKHSSLQWMIKMLLLPPPRPTTLQALSAINCVRLQRHGTVLLIASPFEAERGLQINEKNAATILQACSALDSTKRSLSRQNETCGHQSKDHWWQQMSLWMLFLSSLNKNKRRVQMKVCNK